MLADCGFIGGSCCLLVQFHDAALYVLPAEVWTCYNESRDGEGMAVVGGGGCGRCGGGRVVVVFVAVCV